MVTAGVDSSFGDNLSILENEHAPNDLVLTAIRSCKRFLCLETAKSEDDAYDILRKVESDQLIHFVSLLLRCINRLIDESQNINSDIFDVFGSVISFIPSGSHISSNNICLCFVSVQKLIEYELTKNLKQGDVKESKLSLELILKLIQFLSSVSDGSLSNLGSEVQYSQIMISILKCLNITESSAEHNILTSLKTEILKVFEKLFASEKNDSLKVVLKDKLDVWIEKLIPLMFEEDKNLRTAAVAAIKIFWSYFSISERSRGFTCTPKFQNDLQHSYEMKLLTFLEKGIEEPNWATLWCVLLDVLETQLITSQNIQLINSLLTVETKAFKQSNEARDAAFTCWKYLIGKFCVLNEGVLKKRLHLLLQPLEAGNNAKTDQLACHKCDVWWYFICQTESKNKELTQGIVVPFLNFCFGSPVEISQYNVNAFSGRRCRRYDKFRVLSIDALAQILSPVATEEIAKIDFKLQRCSTPIIDLSMLINHTRLLINCAAESVVCIAFGSCPPTYHVNILVDFIWESLMYQLLVLIRSDDNTNARTTEIVKDFFRFIQSLGKQCTTTNLANLFLSPILESIICGKNALPADILTSTVYQLRLADVLAGTPTSLLMECLLTPIILSLEGHIPKFMNLIDILIEYGVKSSDSLNFSFGVIKRLETLEACVSSCSSGPPALCGTWHSLASKLSPILQTLHQQDGDSFQRLTTSILNYPIVNANICIDGQRKLPSNYQELHQVWKIFLQEIINIDSEENCMENKVCDHICLKILEYLKKHKHMSQPLLYISIFVNHIGTVMPYESINCFLNKSDMRTSRLSVEKPFQQMSGFVEVLHQLSTMLFACKERDSQLYYCVVVYIAQCLSNLFGHIENSVIALALISKLSQLIIFLLKLETPSVTVVDFYENIFSMWKEYTSLVNKFWIDMDSIVIKTYIFPAVQSALEFGSEHLKLFTKEAWDKILLSSDLTPQVLKEKLSKINCEMDVNCSEKELTFSTSNNVVNDNSLNVKQAADLNIIELKTFKSDSDGEISSSVNYKSQDIQELNAVSSIENKTPVSIETIDSSSKLTDHASSSGEILSESVVDSGDSSLEPCGSNSDGKQLPNSTTKDDDTALDSCKVTVNNVVNEIDNSEAFSNMRSKTESERSYGSFNIRASPPNSCSPSQDVSDSFSLQLTSDKNTEQNKIDQNIETFQFLKPETETPCEAEKGSGSLKKNMCLTKHQKEMMRKRSDDIPALYSDLSQDTQNSLLSESEDSQGTMPERMSVTSTRSEDIPQSFSILFKRAIKPNSLDTLIKNNLQDDCNKSSAVSSSTCNENELKGCMNLDSTTLNVSTPTNSEEELSNSEECEGSKVTLTDKNCVDFKMNPDSCLKETAELKEQCVNYEDHAKEEKCDMTESSSPQNRRKTRRPEKKDVIFLRSKRIQSRILTKQNLDPIQQNLAKKLSSNKLLVRLDDISGSRKMLSNAQNVTCNEDNNDKIGVGNKSSLKRVCHKSNSDVVSNKTALTTLKSVHNDIDDRNSLKLKFETKCDTNISEPDTSSRRTSNKTSTKSSVHKVVLKRNPEAVDKNSDKINSNETLGTNSIIELNTTTENKQINNRLIVPLKSMSSLDENNSGSNVTNVHSNLENNCKNDKVTKNKRRWPRKFLDTKSRSRRSKNVKKFEGCDSLKDKSISDYFLDKDSSRTSKETITNQNIGSVGLQGISNRRRKLNDSEPYTNIKKRKIDLNSHELASKPSRIIGNNDKNDKPDSFPLMEETSLNTITEISTNKECIKEKVCSISNKHEIENCSSAAVNENLENLPCMKGSEKDDKSCSGCSVLLESVRDNSQSPDSLLQERECKPITGVVHPVNEDNDVMHKISEIPDSECGQHLNENNTSSSSAASYHTDAEIAEKVCSQLVQNETLRSGESPYPSDSQDVIESSQDSSLCAMPLHISKLNAIKNNRANNLLSVSKQELALNSCLSLASQKNLKSKSGIDDPLPSIHGEQSDTVSNFETKVTCSESSRDSISSVYEETKQNADLTLTDEPQINQSVNVCDPSPNKRRRKEAIERLMKNLEIDFKSSFVPSGSRQPNTLEKKRNSLSTSKNETKSSVKRRHSASSDNKRNKRRGERDVKQSKKEPKHFQSQNLNEEPHSSDSPMTNISHSECQVANKEEGYNNSQSNLTYVDKGTCTDSEDLRIRIIFAVDEDKVCHKLDSTNDKSDGDKQRILPKLGNISIPYVPDSKFDNNSISDNAVEDSSECIEEIGVTDSHNTFNETQNLDKSIDNSKNTIDVNKSCVTLDKVQVLVHSKMDNVGLNSLHNDSAEHLRALDLISINSFNTSVEKSSNNISELKENSFPSADCDMTMSHCSDQLNFTSRPKLSIHLRKKKHTILGPSIGDTKSKFKNHSSPAKTRNAESKILSSGMTGRAAHLLGLAVSEVASDERNQPSTSQVKEKKEIRQFKEMQMDKKEDCNADKIYITSSDGHVSTSLWVKHEYKSEAIPSATILKQQKEPVIQQHHEATTGVSCVELSPGRMRKRVSFFDPVVSHKLLFRSDGPGIVHMFDDPIPEESNDFYGTSNEFAQECNFHNEPQVNISPVCSSQNDAILDSQSPIWPTLTECENPIDEIIADITTSCWTESTIAAFKERGIATVRDLCKLNESSFKKLQISSPNLETVKLAIKRYEEKLLNLMDTSGPFMDENPQHESVTIEEISDETYDCTDETEDECCVELCEETVQIDKDSEYDTSDIIKASDNFEDSLSLDEHIDLIARKYSAREIYSTLESKGIFKPKSCRDVATLVSNCVCDEETVNALKTLGEFYEKSKVHLLIPHN